MGEGFENTMFGGDVIVRQHAHSPNYVAGASGWSINRDGSAEFNDVTVRGNINIDGSHAILIYGPGVPGPGNLIVSLSGAAGVDPFGNAYPAGLTLPTVAAFADPGTLLFRDIGAADFGGVYQGSGGSHAVTIKGGKLNAVGTDIGAFIIVNRNDGTAASIGLIPGVSAGGWDHADIQLRPTILGNGITIDSNNVGVNRFAIGAGALGGYYYEEFTFPAIAVPNAVTTNLLANALVQSFNDYPASAYNMATGQWTAPDDGVYSISCSASLVPTPTTNARALIDASSAALSGGTIYRRKSLSELTGVGMDETLSFTQFFAAGTPVFFSIFCNAGGPYTVSITRNNRLSIARNL